MPAMRGRTNTRGKTRDTGLKSYPDVPRNWKINLADIGARVRVGSVRLLSTECCEWDAALAASNRRHWPVAA
jgi:hypothetical protein